MEIKQIASKKIPFDIHEWNDEVKAYIKPLNGFERLVLNDFFISFYRRTNDPETRFDAGFRAALLALVTEDDQPLFTEEDRDAVRNGSFLPFFRLFDKIIENDDDKELETTKKN